MSILSPSERTARSISESVCVRAICIKDDQILVIRRNNHDLTYATLPGGHLENDESPESGVIREVHEETSVKIEPSSLLWDQPARAEYSRQFYIICKYIEGTPHLDPESEEFAENQLGQNTYEPIFVDFNSIRAELVPPELIPHLDNYFKKIKS